MINETTNFLWFVFKGKDKYIDPLIEKNQQICENDSTDEEIENENS